MVLGKAIGIVETAFFPVDFELFLADTVTHPVELHIHDLGAALFDGLVENAGDSAVVCDDRCGRLWMAQFFKAGAEGTRFFAVVLQGCSFRLGGTGDNNIDDVADDGDRAIGERAGASPVVESWGFGPR